MRSTGAKNVKDRQKGKSEPTVRRLSGHLQKVELSAPIKLDLHCRYGLYGGLIPYRDLGGIL